MNFDTLTSIAPALLDSGVSFELQSSPARVSRIAAYARAVAELSATDAVAMRISEAAGREIASLDEKGNEIGYGYDAAGNRLSAVDALGNETKSIRWDVTTGEDRFNPNNLRQLGVR